MNSLYKEETFKLEGGKTDTKKLQKIEAGRKNQRNSQNTYRVKQRLNKKNIYYTYIIN